MPGSKGKRIVGPAFGILLTLVLISMVVAQEEKTAPSPAATPGEFHYQSLGRRDPFKSLLILQEKVKDLSNLPPIQQMDLKSMKVLGVIIDTGGNRSMIRGADGKTYVVKVGDIIGKNEGEVISIDFNGITVKERFLDFMNNETVVTTVLEAATKP